MTSPTAQSTLVDYDRLSADLAAKRAQYAAAQPFPHLVFDDVLFPEVFDRAPDLDGDGTH